MIKRYISVAVTFGITFLFLSCTTPQDVLSDYNKHFEKVATVTQNILDTDNGAAMLQELYKVNVEHTLVLTAPLGCESYEWKITDVGGKNLHEERTGMRLTLYIPDTVLHAKVLGAPGKSMLYDITLTVKYKGEVYSDTTVLILYATD